MSEFHRASPSRTSPSTLEVTAMLAIHTNRSQGCTGTQTSPNTKQPIHFWGLFLTTQGLAGLLQCMLCCLALGSSLTCPTWTTLPQLLLTSSLHIPHCQHPDAANSFITWVTKEPSYCSREFHKQPSVLTELARCLRYVACQKKPSSTEANGLQSKNMFPTP